MIQNEDKEYKAIEELQKILYSNEPYSEYLKFISKPQSNSTSAAALPWKQDEFLSKRLSYLQYGFGARTKQTLEQMYPNTKLTLPEEDWNSLGIEYSENHAPKFANINEMGLDFPEFLDYKKVQSVNYESSVVERFCFFSGISSFQQGITLEEFSQLDDSSMFKLRDDVNVCKSFLNIENLPWISTEGVELFYIIYRDNASYLNSKIMIQAISIRIYHFMKFIISDQSLTTTLELLNATFDQDHLAEGLLYCLQNGFLVSI